MDEKGIKWWVRFVLVPIFTCAGFYMLILTYNVDGREPSSFVCSQKIKISIYTAQGENDQRVKLLKKILTADDNKCVVVKVSNIKSEDLEVRFFNKDDAYSASLIGAFIVDNTNINISTKYLPKYASTGEPGSIEIWLK